MFTQPRIGSPAQRYRQAAARAHVPLRAERRGVAHGAFVPRRLVRSAGPVAPAVVATAAVAASALSSARDAYAAGVEELSAPPPAVTWPLHTVVGIGALLLGVAARSYLRGVRREREIPVDEQESPDAYRTGWLADPTLVPAAVLDCSDVLPTLDAEAAGDSDCLFTTHLLLRPAHAPTTLSEHLDAVIRGLRQVCVYPSDRILQRLDLRYDLPPNLSVREQRAFVHVLQRRPELANHFSLLSAVNRSLLPLLWCGAMTLVGIEVDVLRDALTMETVGELLPKRVQWGGLLGALVGLAIGLTFSNRAARRDLAQLEQVLRFDGRLHLFCNNAPIATLHHWRTLPGWSDTRVEWLTPPPTPQTSTLELGL